MNSWSPDNVSTISSHSDLPVSLSVYESCSLSVFSIFSSASSIVLTESYIFYSAFCISWSVTLWWFELESLSYYVRDYF